MVLSTKKPLFCQHQYSELMDRNELSNMTYSFGKANATREVINTVFVYETKLNYIRYVLIISMFGDER